ncbi:hypothetical protein A9Q86_15730 [Flavobacteriales bacterium 33_180_T64]|nr:hypothetical protein A9Q86_15730 [Flavobacteriales bacterium 33_180_T64]
MLQSERYLNGLIEKDNVVTLKIYKKNFPKIELYILRNNGEREDAKDVFHDALLYLIIKHKEKPLKINSFEAYLFTTCKNIWRTKLKNKKEWVIKDNSVPLISKEDDLSLFILKEEYLDLYRDMFQLLSENCKEILGKYFSGQSYEDILNDLSYSSINTVRQRVFKCKSKIIKLIKADSRFLKLNK